MFMTWTFQHLRAALESGPPLLGVVVDATVKATALLLAAALATLLVRRASAAARHFVWSLAAAGTLALPILAALLPSWRVAMLPPEEAAPQPPALAAPALLEAPADLDVAPAVLERRMPRPRVELLDADLRLLEAPPPPAPLRKAPRPAPFRSELVPSRALRAPLVPAHERVLLPLPAVEAPPSAARAWDVPAGTWLAVLWAAGFALALLKILAGRIGVRLLARRASAVTEPAALAVVERLRRRMGIRRPVALMEAERATLPMTWGVLRPVVLLPVDAHSWSMDRLELVLLHELAHVRRLDALTQLVAQLACAVYWFHPMVWLAARRMRALREYACDDHVLNAGTRASAYAGEMLEIVRSLRSDPLAPASATLAMARRSHFEGRLLAILDPKCRRRAFGSRAAGTIGALGLMVLMPLAALQPTAAAQTQPPAPPQNAPSGSLPRLSTKESERRRSATVPEAAVAPATPAPPAQAAPAVNPAPPAPPAPLAPVGFPAPPTPPTPPAPPAPPSGDPYRLECLSRAGDNVRWKIAQNDDRFRSKASIDGGRCKLSVEATGKLFFTPNLSDVAGMAPGAAFRAQEVNGELTRTIEIRADGSGKVTREWRLNGQPRALDAEAKMFLAALLAQLDRASGYPSSNRVGEAEADEVRVSPDGRERRGGRETIDQAVAGIRGDDELLHALARLAKESDALEDAGARQAYLRACDRFRSGEARARALKHFLMAAPIDVESGRAVLSSARSIQGDDELMVVLKAMNQIRESDLVRGPLAAPYLDAASRLHSEDALAKALVSLLHPEAVSPEGVLRALELAGSRLRTDESKHRVLVEVTDHQGLDPKVKARSLQIVSTLRDPKLQADAKMRLEHHADCDDDHDKDKKRTALNIHVGRNPIRVEVDGNDLRVEARAIQEEAQRIAQEVARENQETAMEAAREAKRTAEEASRRQQHERIREKARQEADEARRQWSAETERLRAQAQQLKAQARQLSQQMKERARKLKQKLSRELPPEEVEELNLDELDELDFEL